MSFYKRISQFFWYPLIPLHILSHSFTAHDDYAKLTFNLGLSMTTQAPPTLLRRGPLDWMCICPFGSSLAVSLEPCLRENWEDHQPWKHNKRALYHSLRLLSFTVGCTDLCRPVIHLLHPDNDLHPGAPVPECPSQHAPGDARLDRRCLLSAAGGRYLYLPI